jgi:P4 family phage/plasmid primase-like protien
MQTNLSSFRDRVKSAATGRWSFIVSTIARVPADRLSKKHGACPKCGGKDRFRVFPDFDKIGGAVCNQCGKFADGFSTLEWLTGRKFTEVLGLVASLLGVSKESAKGPIDPAYHLEWIDWNESLVSLWCLKHRPIIPEAIKLAGGRMARYRGQFTVIALPVWVGNRSNVVGWRIWNVSGKLPNKSKSKDKDGKEILELVKSKLTYGSQPGMLGTIQSKPTEVWKVEGETDMLALLSVNPRGSVVCNSNGCGQNPATFNWVKDAIGKAGSFLICHDADNPGQDGAANWSKYFTAILKDCQVANVELPYSIQPTKGKDLRDWIAEGNDYQKLLQQARKFEPFEGSDMIPVEAEDDPHRLARLNLEQYEARHDGRLVFWRDEWWKYKAGRYKQIELSELRAKVTASIRSEFVKGWKARQESRANDADQPVRKVTKPIVSNVIGAMESLVVQPKNLDMPCWLPSRKQRNYLSMLNGILDLDALFAGKEIDECLIAHTSHWFSSTRLNYPFDPDAKCQKWLDYIEFVTGGDNEKKMLMQEWAGYLLTTSSGEQKFFVFEGEGNNGKSSFFAGIEAMLGRENVSHLSLENFGQTFSLASTIGKAANIAGDVGRVEGGEEAIIKRYTGGEALEINRKYAPVLTIRPTAKLMMAWNERPRFRDKSDGLWRRMILIPLNQKVPPEKRIKGMDRPDYWEPEAPGIMIWAIAGLARLIANGNFSECKAANEALEEYKAEANPTIRFFEDNITSKDDSLLDSKRVYLLYRHWCEQEGHHPLNDRAFGKQLMKFFPDTKKNRSRYGKKLVWEYSGIAWTVEDVSGKAVSDDFFK